MPSGTGGGPDRNGKAKRRRRPAPGLAEIARSAEFRSAMARARFGLGAALAVVAAFCAHAAIMAVR